LLPISGIVIVFQRSNDFLRSSLILHGLAAYLLIRSAIPNTLMVIVLLMLIMNLIWFCYNGLPCPRYKQLSFHGAHWFLETVTTNTIRFQNARIVFDGGLFFLLKLSNEQNSRTLFIFKDQITIAEYRVLKFIEKRSNKNQN